MDDSVATVAELKQIVKNFSDDRDWDKFDEGKDLAIGIVTEASELLHEFRFKSDAEVKTMLQDSSTAERLGMKSLIH
jgi:hypothetical protein